MKIPVYYLDKIRAAYPNIEFEHLDFNQDGMVNDVVVVNHELVSRLAREDWGSHTVRSRIISQLPTFHYQLHTIPTEILLEAEISNSSSVRSRQDWLQLYEQVQQNLFLYLWRHQKSRNDFWVR
ncbi:MAG: hypothetical protein NHB32_21735 [Fischerella sp. CENA71]|nr:hypothetical protein [Fischerella sp. CENA71]